MRLGKTLRSKSQTPCDRPTDRLQECIGGDQSRIEPPRTNLDLFHCGSPLLFWRSMARAPALCLPNELNRLSESAPGLPFSQSDFYVFCPGKVRHPHHHRVERSPRGSMGSVF